MVNFHTNAEMVVLLFLYIYCLYYIIYIASLPFYLLCQFLKSEADIVEVTVMEVFRKEKSVRRVRAGSKSVSDRLLILWQDYHLYRQQANFFHHFKY